MQEVYNRQCSECCCEVPAEYDSNNCPDCGAESIPTQSTSVIKQWPDNSSVQLFWDGENAWLSELVAILPTQPPSLLSSNFEAHFSLKIFFESLNVFSLR